MATQTQDAYIVAATRTPVGKARGMLRNTRPFSVFGLPTISIPCGFSRSGLPIGLQISGAPGAEAVVLAMAKAYEAQTEWHTRRPGI